MQMVTVTRRRKSEVNIANTIKQQKRKWQLAH